VVLLAGAALATLGTARQMRAQQHYIEDGNRRVIGEWLRDHARPGDTVFMEPLGYIGFYSGLKTYDWPGMSSREVVQAYRLVGGSWMDILLWLQPDWLVLRGQGDGSLHLLAPLLAEGYERVRDFNRRPEVEQLAVPGRGLLEFDAHFVLFRRKQPLRQDSGDLRISSPIPSSMQTMFGQQMRLVHAPGLMVVPLAPSAHTLSVTFGLPDAAWSGPAPTDGAKFIIWLADGDRRQLLHYRLLDPAANPQDRGRQALTLELPPRPGHGLASLIFSTETNGSMAKDWTFWSVPEIR
jgi:hypothetical protein